jgi:hypothetical protein
VGELSRNRHETDPEPDSDSGLFSAGRSDVAGPCIGADGPQGGLARLVAAVNRTAQEEPLGVDLSVTLNPKTIKHGGRHVALRCSLLIFPPQKRS